MSNEETKIATAFAKHLAAYKVPDDTVKTLAKHVIEAGGKPRRLDICQLGICIDYHTPRSGLGELINRLERAQNLGRIEVFPEGIINPDGFGVNVTYRVER